MADQVLVLDPNPFFLSRNKQPHYGDRIEFATHIDRSLPIADAVALTASLAFLIDDDDAQSWANFAARKHLLNKPPKPSTPKTNRKAIRAQLQSSLCRSFKCRSGNIIARCGTAGRLNSISPGSRATTPNGSVFFCRSNCSNLLNLLTRKI